MSESERETNRQRYTEKGRRRLIFKTKGLHFNSLKFAMAKVIIKKQQQITTNVVYTLYQQSDSLPLFITGNRMPYW